jgi:hypothetical protein
MKLVTRKRIDWLSLPRTIAQAPEKDKIADGLCAVGHSRLEGYQAMGREIREERAV